MAHTGITARLLNLEANAVSNIEINPKLDDYDNRIYQPAGQRRRMPYDNGSTYPVDRGINAGVALMLSIIGLALSIYFH